MQRYICILAWLALNICRVTCLRTVAHWMLGDFVPDLRLLSEPFDTEIIIRLLTLR